jgi:hypothetical protein
MTVMLDLGDMASIFDCVAVITLRIRQLDAVIFNAGYLKITPFNDIGEEVAISGPNVPVIIGESRYIKKPVGKIF